MTHSMISALKELKGNAKYSVLTEPLFGIPHSMYAPFASVYMLSFGLSDARIGMIASLVLLVRTLSAIFGGVIIDKMGRKHTTFLFDLLAWSVPCLLWAFAQSPIWFYAAALFNGLWQITDNSFTCLLVEDVDKRLLIDVYDWIYVATHISVFFVPLAGVLVGQIGIVTAVRILYGLSFVLMTLKFVLLHCLSKETEVGRHRMEDTKSMSYLAILKEYKVLLPRFFRSEEMVVATLLSLLLTIANTVTDTFFGIYATQTLGLADQYLSVFPIIRSAIMLLFLFFVQPRLLDLGFRKPMLAGVVMFVIAHALLILVPMLFAVDGLLLLVLYALFQSCAFALVMPRKDSVVALSLQHEERARMTSIMTELMLLISIPFGSLAGLLSHINRRLPFVLNIALFVAAFAVVFSSKTLQAMTKNE